MIKSKKKILITGGAGFIGSALKRTLQENKVNIFSIGRSEKEDYKIELRDPLLKKIIIDFSPDVICHFASGSNIKRAEENKEKEFSDTVLLTQALVDTITNLNLSNIKFIYLSSQSVYGPPLYLPVNEKHPTNPSTVYGINKLKAEQIIIQSNTNYLIFRLSSIYGKEQDYSKSGVVAAFIHRLKNNLPPIVFNSPALFTDFIYIKDVVNAINSAIENDYIEKGIFNLGSGTPTSLQELLNILYKYFPKALPPQIQSNSLYPTKNKNGLYFDITKIKSQLNWSTKYNIEDGLRDMLRPETRDQRAGIRN